MESSTSGFQSSGDERATHLAFRLELESRSPLFVPAAERLRNTGNRGRLVQTMTTEKTSVTTAASAPATVPDPRLVQSQAGDDDDKAGGVLIASNSTDGSDPGRPRDGIVYLHGFRFAIVAAMFVCLLTSSY